MLKRNVLFGNGVNIEFSNSDEYKNYEILQRMCNNLEEEGRYEDVFEGTVKAEDMKGFMEGLNEWFKNKALKGIGALRWIDNEDEMFALLEMSKRYKGKNPDVLEIGLEDYLLGLKLFNASYGEDALNFQTLYQGITLLMLDAIYNDGKIEEIYKNMECMRDELKKYNNIFTLNYDSNIDMLVEKTVYHLHGSFARLHHEYRPETFKGWAILQCGKTLPKYIVGKEYLYSDAIFGFSGKDKLERMKEYNKVYDEPSVQKIILYHPELEKPKYPIDEFKQIDGELHMIGVCPNNDSHIFQMINDNSNIKRIVYYSASSDDSKRIQQILNKPVTIRDVFKYWKKIKN